MSNIGPVQRQVLKYVRDHPGCTMGEVARFYDNPRKGVRYVWALNTQRLLAVGYPAISTSTLGTSFGPSGYSYVGTGGTGAGGTTPRQEFGITVTYSVGSR